MSSRATPEIAVEDAEEVATGEGPEAAPSRPLHVEIQEMDAIRLEGVTQRADLRRLARSPRSQRSAPIARLVSRAWPAVLLILMIAFGKVPENAQGVFLVSAIAAGVLLLLAAWGWIGRRYRRAVAELAAALGARLADGAAPSLSLLDWLDKKWAGPVNIQDAWRRNEAGGHPYPGVWFMTLEHEGNEAGIFVVDDPRIPGAGQPDDEDPRPLPAVRRIDLYYPAWNVAPRVVATPIERRLAELGFVGAVGHGGVHLVRHGLSAAALKPDVMRAALDDAYEIAFGEQPRRGRRGGYRR